MCRSSNTSTKLQHQGLSRLLPIYFYYKAELVKNLLMSNENNLFELSKIVIYEKFDFSFEHGISEEKLGAFVAGKNFAGSSLTFVTRQSCISNVMCDSICLKC